MLDVDVLIVGGGASGLTASMLLSTYGISSHLVSRYAETSKLPKAHLLSTKTMEMYRELGVEEAIRAISCPDENMRYVGWFAGLAGPHEDYGRKIMRLAAWGRGRQDLDWSVMSDNGYTNLTQSRLEPLLRARAEELAPASVHFFHSYVCFKEHPDGIIATIEDRASGTRYQVRAQYLLACDGGRAVGPEIGVAMEGHLAVATSISIHFSADLSAWARDPEVLIRTILNPDTGKVCVLVPMGPDAWGPASREWVFHLVAFPGDHKQLDDASAIAEMKKVLGLPDFEPEVHMINRWPLDAVVASRFRVGRAFVLGDAAHRMPPAGGHGLNSAVQDAYNICWKLATVLRGHANEALLDTYEEERRPVAQKTVASAYQNWQNNRVLAQALGFSPLHSAEENWRNIRLQWGDGPEAEAARRTTGEALANMLPAYNHININYGYTYTSGAFVDDGNQARAPHHPLFVYQPSTHPGHSVPHAWLETTMGRVSINESVGHGQFVLIAGENGEDWCKAAREIAAESGLPLQAMRIGTNSGDVFDYRYEWERRREFGADGAILVRPDRFVMWRAMSMAGDPKMALRDALRSILYAPSRSGAASPTEDSSKSLVRLEA